MDESPPRGARPATTPAPAGLIARLAAMVGSAHCLMGSDLTVAYTRDWTGRFTGAASAVVRPATTAHVAAVVTACRAADWPVLPQGGNTGLVGGAVPVAGSAHATQAGPRAHQAPVVMSLTRLDHLAPVDAVSRTVVVGAGASLAAVQRHARAAGLDYGVDIASRDTATIGGTIATNAGGIRVCAYGMTRRHVAGVEAVLADGSVVSSMRGLAKDNTGYDLPGLLTGSEGTLGIITAALLHLQPAPSPASTALLGVPSLAAARDLAADLPDRLGARLVAAEVFDRVGAESVCAVRGMAWPLASRDWPWLLLLEAEPAAQSEAGAESGPGAAASASLDWSRLLPPDVDAVVAADPADAARLWEYREGQTEAAAHLAAPGGVIHKFDVSVPPAALDEFVDTVREAAAASGFVDAMSVFGHVADANLHLEVAGPAADNERPTELVLAEVARLGGAISAEHGIGQAKARWLGLSRSDTEIAAMRAIKAGLDPTGILAPGVLLTAHEQRQESS